MPKFEVLGLDAFSESVMDASVNQPIVSIFWAQWCAPCKSLKPLLLNMAETRRFPLAMIDAGLEQNRPLCASLKIRALPTVMVHGNRIQTVVFTGAKTEQDLYVTLARAGVFAGA